MARRTYPFTDWSQFYTDEQRAKFRERRKMRIDTRRDLKDRNVDLRVEGALVREDELAVRRKAVDLKRRKLAMEEESLDRLKELQAEYLGNEDLLKIHREILCRRDKRGDLDLRGTMQALEMAYRLKGLFAPSVSIKRSVKRGVDGSERVEDGVEVGDVVGSRLSDERRMEIDRALGVEGGGVKSMGDRKKYDDGSVIDV